MTSLRGWCSCGGPLWRENPWDDSVYCRLCRIVGMTSQQVRWHDDEERGYDIEGVSINALLYDEWPSRSIVICNDTTNSPATSTWLPANVRDMRIMTSTDGEDTEDHLDVWLDLATRGVKPAPRRVLWFTNPHRPTVSAHLTP